MLAIHKVFLRFFPYLTQIPAVFRCYAVLKWELFFKTNNKIPGMLTHFGDFLCGIGEKGPFKTITSLWSVALGRLFYCVLLGMKAKSAIEGRACFLLAKGEEMR